MIPSRARINRQAASPHGPFWRAAGAPLLLILAGAAPSPEPSEPAVPLTDGTVLRGTLTEKTVKKTDAASTVDSVFLEDAQAHVTRVAAELVAWDRLPAGALDALPSMPDAYAARLKAHIKEDAKSNFDLGIWLFKRGDWRMDDPGKGHARNEGMRLLRTAKAAAPEYAPAWEFFGYRKEEGKWVHETELEFRRMQQQKGFEQHEGRWVTANEKKYLEDPVKESVWDLRRTFFDGEAKDPVDPSKVVRLSAEERTALWEEKYQGRVVRWSGVIENIREEKDGTVVIEVKFVRNADKEDKTWVLVTVEKGLKGAGGVYLPEGLKDAGERFARADPVDAWPIPEDAEKAKLGPSPGIKAGHTVKFRGRLTRLMAETESVHFKLEAGPYDLHREQQDQPESELPWPKKE